MLLAAGLICAAAVAAAGATGTVFIDSRLLAQPLFGAREVAKVPADTRVTVLDGRGMWLRVSAPGAGEGWIRRFDVRTGEPGRQAGRDSGSWLSRLFSGGDDGGGRVTNTIGIRGLDAVDIDKARSDPRQVAQLDRYRADAAAAARLASDAGLRSRDVAYVTGAEAPAPKRGGNIFDLNF